MGLNFGIKSTLKILKILFNLRKHNDVLNMLYEFSLIEYHKKIASHQRLCFNNQKKNESLLKDNLLFVMDYKEKIRLGVD